MNDLLPITIGDMIAELERESALRVRVYARWVADGKLSPEKADRQLAVLRAAIEQLRACRIG